MSSEVVFLVIDLKIAGILGIKGKLLLDSYKKNLSAPVNLRKTKALSIKLDVSEE